MPPLYPPGTNSLPPGGTLIINQTPIIGGTNGYVLYDNNGVVGVEAGGGGGSLTIGTTPISGGTANYALTVDPTGLLLNETPIRTILTGNLSLYVDASTGSDSYNGLSATYTGGVNGPFATIQHSINIASATYDLAGFTIIDNIAAGSYVGAGAKPMFGGGNFFLKLDPSATVTGGPNDGIFNNGEAISLYALATGTTWYMGGGTLDGSLIPAAGASAGANIFVGDNNILVFQDPTNLSTPVSIASIANSNIGHFQSDVLGQLQDAGANITVSGDATFVISALAGSEQLMTGNYTLSGAQAYSQGFFCGDGVSFSVLFPTIVSGTATGPQFLLLHGAAVKGVDPTTLPGDTAGTIDESSSWNGASGGPAINTQTASYQLVFSDAGATVEMNAAGANNLTVPANATTPFPINSRIDIVQTGAGKTTVVAAGGVTIRSASGNLSIASQYSGATIYKRGTDEWVLIGELGP